MVQIPTVKTFCGCCDLKTSCIIIAVIQLVAATILLAVMLFMAFFTGLAVGQSETSSNKDQEVEKGFVALFVFILFCLLIPLCALNILVCYWFIRGITMKQPAKMKYYVYLCQVNIIFIILDTSASNILGSLISIALACYIFVCAKSTYELCLAESHGNVDNIAGNAAIKFESGPSVEPPSYTTCMNETQAPNTEAYLKQMP